VIVTGFMREKVVIPICFLVLISISGCLSQSDPEEKKKRIEEEDWFLYDGKEEGFGEGEVKLVVIDDNYMINKNRTFVLEWDYSEFSFDFDTGNLYSDNNVWNITLNHTQFIDFESGFTVKTKRYLGANFSREKNGKKQEVYAEYISYSNYTYEDRPPVGKPDKGTVYSVKRTIKNHNIEIVDGDVKEESNTTQEEHTEYRIDGEKEVTVKAGRFTCIEEQSLEFKGNSKTITYIDAETGMKIKILEYEDGVITSSLELIDYSY
jgi:hypothetical protein